MRGKLVVRWRRFSSFVPALLWVVVLFALESQAGKTGTRGNALEAESPSGAPELLRAKVDDNSKQCKFVRAVGDKLLKPLIKMNMSWLMSQMNTEEKSGMSKSGIIDTDTFAVVGGSEEEQSKNINDAVHALKSEAQRKILSEVAHQVENKKVLLFGSDIMSPIIMQTSAEKVISFEGDVKKCEGYLKLQEQFCGNDENLRYFCIPRKQQLNNKTNNDQESDSETNVKQQLKAIHKVVDAELGEGGQAGLVSIGMDHPVAIALMVLEFIDQSALVMVRSSMTAEAKDVLSKYYDLSKYVAPSEADDNSKTSSRSMLLLRPSYRTKPVTDEWEKYVGSEWSLVGDKPMVEKLNKLNEKLFENYKKEIDEQKELIALKEEMKIIKKYVQGISSNQKVHFGDFIAELSGQIEKQTPLGVMKASIQAYVGKIREEVIGKEGYLKPFLLPFSNRVEKTTDPNMRRRFNNLFTFFLLETGDIPSNGGAKELLEESLEEQEKILKKDNGDEDFLKTLAALILDIERIKSAKEPLSTKNKRAEKLKEFKASLKDETKNPKGDFSRNVEAVNKYLAANFPEKVKKTSS